MFLLAYPEHLTQTHQWAESDNRWLRRAATVSYIPSLPQGKCFGEAAEMIGGLFEDDLVLKGCGWTLKEATKKYPDRYRTTIDCPAP